MDRWGRRSLYVIYSAAVHVSFLPSCTDVYEKNLLWTWKYATDLVIYSQRELWELLNKFVSFNLEFVILFIKVGFLKEYSHLVDFLV